MDILTIMGVVVGLAALIGGQHLEGGHLSSVMQFTAAIIVRKEETGNFIKFQRAFEASARFDLRRGRTVAYDFGDKTIKERNRKPPGLRRPG